MLDISWGLGGGMVLPEVGRGQRSSKAVVFLFPACKNSFSPSESQKMLGNGNKRLEGKEFPATGLNIL